MVDTMLTTAPCLPIPAPQLGRTQWSAAARGRISTRTSSARPPVLRISCCSGATTSTSSGGRPETTGEGAGEEVGSTNSSHFGDVYVASIPLRAPKGILQGFLQGLLEAVKDVDFLVDFQHFMTIVKPTGNGDPDDGPCTVLDFQPQNPEDPTLPVAVLLGNSIPGVIQERTLSRLPNQRCWWVGEMKPGLSLEDAVEFNRRYNSELSLGVNDCRHHTLDLVEYLTGRRMSFIEQVWFERELEEALEDSSSESSEEPTAEMIEPPAEEAPVETAT